MLFVLLVHSNLFGSNRRSRRHYVTGTLLRLDHVLFFDNVSSKENIKILWLIFMLYYGDIIAIKNSYWLFSFT